MSTYDEELEQVDLIIQTARKFEDQLRALCEGFEGYEGHQTIRQNISDTFDDLIGDTFYPLKRDMEELRDAEIEEAGGTIEYYARQRLTPARRERDFQPTPQDKEGVYS